MATITTTQVFDFEQASGDPSLTNPPVAAGVQIQCQLNYNQANAVSPAVNVQPNLMTTTTDATGRWQFNLIPNSNINPANTTYLITTPTQRYEIIVPSSGPVQSSTIRVGAPTTLAPATSSTGPLTVTGAFTVNTGPVTLPAGSVSVADLTGVLPVANGGTGSSSQNFVDLTTNQSVGGNKTFTGSTTTSGSLAANGGITSTGEVGGADLKATGSGLAGGQARLVGRTVGGSGGPPGSGTYAVGDFVVDVNGQLWVCTTAGTPGTWTPTCSVKIADLSPSSGSSQSITVPSGFKSVKIRLRVFNSAATGDLGIRFNADAGNNYTWQESGGVGASGTFATGASVSYMRLTALSSTAVACQATVEINNLSGTTNKLLTSTAARLETGNALYSLVNSGFWNSTAAITSIQVVLSAATFATGSSIQAYGDV